MNLLAPIRNRFGELLASMTPRDRKLFVGLVVTFHLCVLGGVWWLASGALADVQGSIDAEQHDLALLSGLASDQAAAGEQAKKIEEQMAKYAGQDLPSFLEKAAQKQGVASNLQGVRDKGTTPDGEIEQHAYTVDLSKVSLEQLVGFLYEVETAGYPLKITSMKAKTVSLAGVKSLNVSLEVSAYRLLQATTEEKSG